MQRHGHARVALVGFPSVGKSTLLTLLTGTESEAAGYEFTTLTCIPGIIHHNDAKIQLLDLPGIIEGAAQGKGRGREVIACAKARPTAPHPPPSGLLSWALPLPPRPVPAALDSRLKARLRFYPPARAPPTRPVRSGNGYATSHACSGQEAKPCVRLKAPAQLWRGAARLLASPPTRPQPTPPGPHCIPSHFISPPIIVPVLRPRSDGP